MKFSIKTLALLSIVSLPVVANESCCGSKKEETKVAVSAASECSSTEQVAAEVQTRAIEVVKVVEQAQEQAQQPAEQQA
mgnify:CR=1 FL=1